MSDSVWLSDIPNSVSDMMSDNSINYSRLSIKIIHAQNSKLFAKQLQKPRVIIMFVGICLTLSDILLNVLTFVWHCLRKKWFIKKKHLSSLRDGNSISHKNVGLLKQPLPLSLWRLQPHRRISRFLMNSSPAATLLNGLWLMKVRNSIRLHACSRTDEFSMLLPM